MGKGDGDRNWFRALDGGSSGEAQHCRRLVGDIVPCWYYCLVLCCVGLLVFLSLYPGLTAAAAAAAAAATAILGVTGLGWFGLGLVWFDGGWMIHTS